MKRDPRIKEIMAWVRRHGFVVDVDPGTALGVIALYDDAFKAGADSSRAEIVEAKRLLLELRCHEVRDDDDPELIAVRSRVDAFLRASDGGARPPSDGA